MKNYLRQGKQVRLPVAFVLMIFLMFGAVSVFAQDITPDLYNVLRYRHIGPPGNRTSAVCGEPGNRRIIGRHLQIHRWGDPMDPHIR